MTASLLLEFPVSGHSSSDTQMHTVIGTLLIAVKSKKVILELEGILEMQMYYFVLRNVTLTYYSVTFLSLSGF